jgi:hypothetical protein
LVLLAFALAGCGGGGASPRDGAAGGTAASRDRIDSRLAALERLSTHERPVGVTYGPYLGKRCRHTGYRDCELIGIDIVLGHAATSVVAIAGDQKISLRTPGKHNGIPYRDWVGNFTHAGLARRRSDRRAGDLIYVGVEVRVRFADGRRDHAFFPRVLVSSGWG